MNPKKRNVILIVGAAVLLIGAVVFGMRDSLFPSKDDARAPEIQQAVRLAQNDAPPLPAEPPKPTFTHGARPAGGK